MKVYLASPLGFSPYYASYLQQIKDALRERGCQVLDPWEQDFQRDLSRVAGEPGWEERIRGFASLAGRIGQVNEELIREADLVFAVLDGLEVDSGTASEVGFGSALGKKCYGLRTDVRDSGDFAGLPCNLQVLHFIHRTGGHIFRSIDDIRFDG